MNGPDLVPTGGGTATVATVAAVAASVALLTMEPDAGKGVAGGAVLQPERVGKISSTIPAKMIAFVDRARWTAFRLISSILMSPYLRPAKLLHHFQAVLARRSKL